MSEFKGTANTVGELIKLLEESPFDFPVRMQSISHEFPVGVRKHDRCIMLEI